MVQVFKFYTIKKTNNKNRKKYSIKKPKKSYSSFLEQLSTSKLESVHYEFYKKLLQLHCKNVKCGHLLDTKYYLHCMVKYNLKVLAKIQKKQNLSKKTDCNQAQLLGTYRKQACIKNRAPFNKGCYTADEQLLRFFNNQGDRLKHIRKFKSQTA